MNGFGQHFPGERLVGWRVEQIGFGTHDLVINCDQMRSVTITSPVAVGADEPTDDYRLIAPAILTILEASIRRVACEAKSAALEFDNGRVLTIYDDSEQFESVVFTFSDRDFIVV